MEEFEGSIVILPVWSMLVELKSDRHSQTQKSQSDIGLEIF